MSTFRSQKQWIAGLRRNNQHLEQQINRVMESEYHRILRMVKAEFNTLKGLAFERDYKHDRESLFLMHSYLTQQFYWELECDHTFCYRIRYAFHQCPFEQDIRDRLQAYPLNEHSSEVKLNADFNIFYLRVLATQPKHFQSYHS